MIDDLYILLTDEGHSLVVENDDIHSFNGRRGAFSEVRAPYSMLLLLPYGDAFCKRLGNDDAR